MKKLALYTLTIGGILVLLAKWPILFGLLLVTFGIAGILLGGYAMIRGHFAVKKADREWRDDLAERRRTRV